MRGAHTPYPVQRDASGEWRISDLSTSCIDIETTNHEGL
jgi:hypothetical protein